MKKVTPIGKPSVPQIRRITLPRLALCWLALFASGCTISSFGLDQQAETTSQNVSQAMPDQRPDDFQAVYFEDGGMAPWSERLQIEGDTASYEVWMSEVTYVFDYSPAEPQLDALYDELRLGRFGEYEVIPFEEGEGVYDGGITDYSVSAGEFSHRIVSSDERLRTPDTDFSPLSALSGFVSTASTAEATNELTISYDPAISDLYLEGLEVRVDLTGAAFAIGEERWAETFPVNWSGGDRTVSVAVSTGPPDGERQVLVERELEIRTGAVLEIFRTEVDSIDVQLSP